MTSLSNTAWAREAREKASSDRDFWAALAPGWQLLGFTDRYRATFVRRGTESMELTAAHVELLLAVERRAKEDALSKCPATAAEPNESAYQRGRFDGIMEYDMAIRSTLPPTSKAESRR